MSRKTLKKPPDESSSRVLLYGLLSFFLIEIVFGLLKGWTTFFTPQSGPNVGINAEDGGAAVFISVMIVMCLAHAMKQLVLGYKPQEPRTVRMNLLKGAMLFGIIAAIGLWISSLVLVALSLATLVAHVCVFIQLDSRKLQFFNLIRQYIANDDFCEVQNDRH
jgi:hypothetical protein